MCVCVVFVVHRTGVKHEIVPNMTFQEVLVKILRLSGCTANNVLIKKEINSENMLVSTVTLEMATNVDQSKQTNKPMKL